MPLKVYAPEEIRAVASKNKLRQYPGVKKGKSRLLPYARPQINTETTFPRDASFFVLGNCYGRNLEKALRRVGRTVLSSPNNLDLPGTAQEQFNRYNIFNLDVSTNEVAWAIDPGAQPIDDALIDVDGEWVDMQIHWTFAHDEASAKQYRKVYNTSYEGIKDADVIIISASGIEQWFDTETGLYMNGMPTNKMTKQSPGRFEFHRLDADACANSLRRFCDLARTTCKSDARILITISPVSQPSVHGPSDALIDQYLAKSLQRAACDVVCAEYDGVEYLPSLETAMLSDFRFGYQETSLNHTTQCLANRVVAEMLEKYEGKSDSQILMHAIGHTEALIAAEDFETAVETAETVTLTDIRATDELNGFYVKALSAMKRHSDAVAYLSGRLLEDDVEDSDFVFPRLINLAKSHGSIEQIDALIAYAEKMGRDTETLIVARAGKLARGTQTNDPAHAHRGVINSLAVALKANDNTTVIEGAIELLELGNGVSEVDQDRIVGFIVQALTRVGQQSGAIEVLLDRLELRETLQPRWSTLCLNLARSHGDTETIDRIMSLSEKFGLDADFSGVKRRQSILAAQAQAA